MASCSIIISWFRLGIRGLSPHSFASCSIILSGFWFGFRGLSPYSFGILFHHPFLVPARVPGLVSVLFWHPVPSSFPGSGYGSGACLPTPLVSCSIILSWLWLGFRGLSPYFFGILFHHHFRVLARVGSGACLPIFLVSCSIIISWFRLGFRACLRTLLASCSIIISWFRLGFRGLSPYFFGILFHHHFRLLARVPGLVSLLFWCPVPSSFPGSG